MTMVNDVTLRSPARRRTTIEAELTGLLCAARLDSRQRRAVARRLGWDGQPPTTLADAGVGCGYTRERVRQLEGRLAAHLARTRPSLPATAAALDTIHAAAPVESGELAQTLVRLRIAARPFDPRGVLRAADMAGLAVTVVARDGVLLRDDQSSVSARSALMARKLVVRDGATSPEAVAAGLGLPVAKVRRLLELRDEVTWLDDRREWLLVPAPRTRVTTALRKMLSVEPQLSLEEIERGLERLRSQTVLPREVVRFICAASSGFRLDREADVVRSTAPLDSTLELSELEQVLVDIFREDGPVLGFGHLTRGAERRGMKAGTAAVYLSRSVVFQQLSRARYALRGYSGNVLHLPTAAAGETQAELVA